MQVAVNYYLNHVWINNVLNPLAPNMNVDLIQTMRGQWDLPHHFNPISLQYMSMDIPFFSPEEITNLNAVFMPWESQNNRVPNTAYPLK